MTNTKRNYTKLNEMKLAIEKFIDGYEDMTAEQYDMWNYKVTVMQQAWCDEYNQVQDGKTARVEDRTIILN